MLFKWESDGRKFPFAYDRDWMLRLRDDSPPRVRRNLDADWLSFGQPIVCFRNGNSPPKLEDKLFVASERVQSWKLTNHVPVVFWIETLRAIVDLSA
ncbi:hypothetical protein K0M31_012901, partial [Melipona bicolor]